MGEMKKNRAVVFGCNALSVEVVTHMHHQEWDLVLAARDSECLDRVKSQGVACRVVDPTSDAELRSLGVGGEVMTVFALFEEEADNVFLTISVKYLDPSVTVVSLSSSDESGKKLRAAGVDRLIDPYKIVGQKLVNMIQRPRVEHLVERLLFGRRHLCVREIRVEAGDKLSGKRLDELDFQGKYQLMLAGIVDREYSDHLAFPLAIPDRRLDPGDVLVVVGQEQKVDLFRRETLSDKEI